MAERYEYVVDLEDLNANFARIAEAVPAGARVLDVGCAVGHLALALAELRDCDVTGVEIDAQMATEARDRGLDVLTLDITAGEAVEKVLAHTGGRRFDVIVFADVLEHLADPVAALRAVHRLLEPTGCVVSSIPNVAHASIRLDLLRGRFEYTETGLLDRTHIQLYTAARVRRDFREAGYVVETFDRSLAPLEVEGRIQAHEVPAPILEATLADPEAWVYQYVTTARRRWDLDALAGRRGLAAPDGGGSDTTIVLVGDVDAATRRRWEVAAQLAGAGDVEVLTERPAGGSSASETRVLVAPADAEPDASWLPALLRHAEPPVGIRLLTPDGTVVHAGADVRGIAIGAGDPDGDGPLYLADRPHAPLLPPYVATAGALAELGPDEHPHGTYTGAVAAHLRTTTEVPSSGRAPTLTEPVLGIGSHAVWRLTPVERSVLLDLARELARQGRRLVLWWPDATAIDHRDNARPFERAGAVILSGNAYTTRSTPDVAALAAALRPTALLRLDTGVTEDLATAALEAADAVRLDLTERPLATADAVVPYGPGAVDAIVAAVRAEATAPRIPSITARPRRPHASIIIPVWNRWDLTAACLDRLAAHTSVPHEVVVVDNASSDDTPVRLSERSDVVTITNDRNLGFAGGTNVGLEAATGEHLVLLNNDTEVTPGWLEALLAPLEDPQVAFTGPRSNRISGLQIIPGAPGLDAGDAAHTFAVDWSRTRAGLAWPAERLVGFCLAGRADVWEQLGGLDEGVGLGNFEDDDLCDRARTAGYVLRVTDGSVVLHHGSATFDSEDVDALATMFAGARHTAPRRHPRAELATVVVLADGQPGASAVSAAGAWAVADGVLAIDRRSAGTTALHVASGHRPVRTVSGDWRGDALGRLLSTVRSAHAIVLGAGERLVADDHALARVELDRSRGRPLVLETPAGPQVRVVPPSAPAPLLGTDGVPSVTMRVVAG